LATVIPRLSTVAALLLMVFVMDATAQKSRPARPVAKSITVDVMRGGSVQIPLQGRERNLNSLKYETIGSPRYGRLSRVEQPPQSEPQGPGYVTYTHGNDEDSEIDTFAFEVVVPLTKMTGRGRITIRIIDALAQLRITPSTLDFGATAIGDAPVRLSVELANVGGGFIQGILEVTEPFALANDGMFVLRRGEKTRIPIIFAPQSAGPYLFPIQPVPSDPALLTLKGEAKQPFAVEAASSIFEEQPDGSRTARATVTNQSQSPQQISVVVPPDIPIEPVPPLDLAPGEAADVTLRIPSAQKTNLAPFSVRFESAAHTVALDFQAPPIPPEVLPVSAPDFGAVKPGTAARAALVLSNTGGAVAQCRLQSGKNLTTVDGATAFSIAPNTAHTVALRLMPRKDEDLPTNVIVAFRDTEMSIPVTAVWAETMVTPTPRPTPTPTPTPTPLALNVGIKLENKNDAAFITYREEPGWTNFVLQHRPDGTSAWQNYQPPAPHEGLFGWIFGWIKGHVRRIQEWLDTPIQRAQVEGIEPEEPSLARIEIAPEEVNGPNLWRLVATPSGQSEPRPVSDTFRITTKGIESAEPEMSFTQAVPSAAPVPVITPSAIESPTAAAGARTIARALKVESAQADRQRNSATIQVVFSRDPKANGYRLEHGFNPVLQDPDTGLFYPGDFRVAPHPTAKATVVGTANTEHEGRELTVLVATIEELDPGTSTTWRVVTMADGQDRWPTGEFIVSTLPPWQFPWRQAMLVAALIALAAVLYLRWRLHRVPR
jgi:hypothetical protein